MSFIIRITRPEHPIVLLREQRDAQDVLTGYEMAFHRNDATEYRTLDYARGTVRQIIDSVPTGESRACRYAWAFKSEILMYQPWVNSETEAPDTEVNPKDWMGRRILGSRISILTTRMQTIETFPLELLK